MPVAAAIPLFLVSLVVTLGAARLFAARLDRLGLRFGFPEALVGLLTALAADGPELSSALFALARGAGGVGVGVLVGSNIFNLAAMIGVSALLAGRVRLARRTLALEGVTAAAVTVLGAAMLVRWLSPAVTAGLSGAVIVPYLALVIGVPAAGLARLRRALSSRPPARTPGERPSRAGERDDPTHHLLALIVLDVALIIAGSVGMVQAALALGSAWGVSHATLGALILAPLTSLPNAYTAIRLGLAGRGGALVGEAFNSNTINLAFGVIVPALVVGATRASRADRLALAWLVGLTALCLALLARPGGLRRLGAAALTAGYLAFVALRLAGL
jgi:cation:H+ antiporter